MNIWEYAQKRLNEAGGQGSDILKQALNGRAQGANLSDREKEALRNYDAQKSGGIQKAFSTKEKDSIGKAGSKKAEALMDSPAISKFERDDFVKLAMLCIDQAGCDVQTQKKIEKMINDALPETKNESPVGGGGSQDGDGGDPENDSEVEETYG